jgi:hypothetical protein
MQQSNWYLTRAAYQNDKVQEAYKILIENIVKAMNPAATIGDIAGMMDLEKRFALVIINISLDFE